MKLVGMLDSPYVRRVAISLDLYGVAFEHQSLSVFRTFDEFSQINPVESSTWVASGLPKVSPISKRRKAF